jgi:uncharacterized protein (TIGR03083 family)
VGFGAPPSPFLASPPGHRVVARLGMTFASPDNVDRDSCIMTRMRVDEVPTVDVRPLLSSERSDLLELLRSLTPDQWVCSTEVPGWRVKDIALHLLDDDLGWLSRGRDCDSSGLLVPTEDYRAFVAELDRKNQQWVDGAHGLSQRVVCDLLAWSGAEVDAFCAAVDLRGAARVIWASVSAVPAWFDLARDFTERWVHHQQIRDALACPGTHFEEHIATVLRTFVWAFPKQYEADATVGTQFAIDLDQGGTWVLTRHAKGWELDEGHAPSVAAAMTMPGDTAWRMLTGGAYDPATITKSGSDDLVAAALRVRSVIV